jgi:polar amino acid transport system permease protein
MNALRIKHRVAGIFGVIAMLAWHPAMAAGLDGVQVLDGFKELVMSVRRSCSAVRGSR